MKYVGPVRRTAEFDRIDRLPRRYWTDENMRALAEAWSPQLLNAQGRDIWNYCLKLTPAAREAEIERHQIRLLDLQAACLYDTHVVGGVVAWLGVGDGKSLVTYLGPRVAPIPATRPIVCVPSNMVDRTIDKYAAYAKVWIAPDPMPRVIGYGELSHMKSEWALCDCAACRPVTEDDPHPVRLGGIRPNFIGLDEGDMVANPSLTRDVALGIRFQRYYANHLGECTTQVLTGSSHRNEIEGFFHHAVWALKGGAPVPFRYTDTQEWGSALNTKLRDGFQRHPGVLLQWAPDYNPNDPRDTVWRTDPLTGEIFGDAEKLKQRAAAGYAERLNTTPGFIISTRKSCEVPLVIRLVKAPDDPILDKAFEELRITEETVDGWPVEGGLSMLAHGTMYGCGFVYLDDPRPSQEYRDKRKAKGEFVRHMIRDTGGTLSSEGHVIRRYKDHDIIKAWLDIKARTPAPKHIAHPLSMSVIGWLVELIRNAPPTLVWVQHRWVGQTLSTLTGLPYFGDNGQDAHGNRIEHYDNNLSAIVAMGSNRRGRDLQGVDGAKGYAHNLIVGLQHSGRWLEQLIGRTHRRGQRAPYVEILIAVLSSETLTALEAACQEADGVQRRSLQPQRLNGAIFDWSGMPREYAANTLPNDHPAKHRWSKHSITLPKDLAVNLPTWVR